MIILRLERTGPLNFTGHKFTEKGLPAKESDAIERGFFVEPRDARIVALAVQMFLAGYSKRPAPSAELVVGILQQEFTAAEELKRASN